MMTRTDICASDDHETIARLQAIIAELGGVADDNWHDSPIGTGLTRFRFGDRELTVFKDAWVVDVAGPEALVNDIVAALASR
jgi:hypothetical protein